MTRFRYSGFYDVPRTIVLEYRGEFFLLDSPFDDGADEYPSHYSVYVFPESLKAAAAGSSWDFMRELGTLVQVESIDIKDVRFDSNRRKKLDAAILDRFFSSGGGEAGGGSGLI